MRRQFRGWWWHSFLKQKGSVSEQVLRTKQARFYVGSFIAATQAKNIFFHYSLPRLKQISPSKKFVAPYILFNKK